MSVLQSALLLLAITNLLRPTIVSGALVALGIGAGVLIHEHTKDFNDGRCIASNQCGEGEGDCDTDEDCAGSLKCGNNNCRGTDIKGISLKLLHIQISFN